MKVNNLNEAHVYQYTNHSQPSHIEGTNRSTKKDVVQISSEAKALQKQSISLADREERLNDIKVSIENGTYSLDPLGTAKGIFNFYR